MEAQPASREPSLLDPTENIPNTNTRQITSTSPLPSLSQNPELTSQDQGQDTSRSSSQGANSTASQASQFAYDPRALLNPKATAKRSRTESTQPEDGSTPDPAEDVSGMRSMIERMHGIQRREDQPVKKQKRELADEQDGRKATFAGGGKSTVLGDYMTEQRKEGEKEAGPPPASSAVVDLTADDDDDLVLIKDSGDEEICLGKLEGVFISAFMVPGPKPTGFQGTANAWPALKVSLRRRPASNNILISVSDPCGRDFARVDALGALGLANLMDNKLLNIRLEARLDSRKRTSGESPGSAVSKRMPLNVHLFAPRKHAKNIGRMLSQKQIWLREPTINIGRIPYDNPQAIKAAAPRTQVASGSNGTQSGYGFVARTVEEVRSDVISMFDSLTKSDEIPQMDQPNIIATDLLAHQKQALHFMTSREADDSASDTDKNSLWKLKLRGNGERYFYNIITGQESRSKPAPTRGGILADMMGLGKTLSILSLVATTLGEASHWSKIKPPQTPGAPLIKCNSKATLLICPVSTVANWEEQVKLHVKHKSMSYYIYHGPNRVADVQKLAGFDLVITTYSVVAADHGKPASKTPLAFINWFRIVLDEAHMIRSTATKQSVATCALLAQRRWAVTGTPVQNRLDDLGALIKFLRIKPFDDKGGFTQYILTPFKNADPDILPKLRILVDSITLRRLKDRIDLPPRQDRIVRLNFSPEERKLYRFFAQDTAARMKSITDGRDKLAKNQMGHILRAMGRLRMICAHGSEMLSNEDMKLAEGLSSDNAIELGDDDEEEDRKPSITKEQAYDMLHLLRESDMHHCGICDQTIGSSTGFNPEEADSSDDESEGIKKERDVNIGFMTPCYQIVCPNCLDEFKQRMKKRAEPNYWMTCPLCGTYVPQTLFPLTQADADRDEAARQRVRDNPRLSKQLGRYGGPHTKVKALIEELLKSKAWSDAHPQEPPIKSVVFSGWTSYLDLISIAFEDNALKYTRLDGTMTRRKRTAALDAFRDDPTVQIMLISINAGGLGLNLTTGSKAYVMEPQYNPAAEAQAVDRVHRLGQKREVTITRFVMNDSFEERMLELQAKKKDLADLSMNRNAKLDKEEAAKKRLEALKSLFR